MQAGANEGHSVASGLEPNTVECPAPSLALTIARFRLTGCLPASCPAAHRPELIRTITSDNAVHWRQENQSSGSCHHQSSRTRSRSGCQRVVSRRPSSDPVRTICRFRLSLRIPNSEIRKSGAHNVRHHQGYTGPLRPILDGQRDDLEFPPGTVGHAILAKQVVFLFLVLRIVALLPCPAIRWIAGQDLVLVTLLRVVCLRPCHCSFLIRLSGQPCP